MSDQASQFSVKQNFLHDFVFKLNLKLKVIAMNFRDKPCMYYATVLFFNKC